MGLSYCVSDADLKLGLDRIEGSRPAIGEGVPVQPRFCIPTDGRFATGWS